MTKKGVDDQSKHCYTEHCPNPGERVWVCWPVSWVYLCDQCRAGATIGDHGVLVDLPETEED